MKDLYIVAEFKSEANNIVNESSKYIGNFKSNMSNIFKKCSNVYILSNFNALPFNEDKGNYSSKDHNALPNKEDKDQYILDRHFLFKDKNNKEKAIDTPNEKAGVNDYYAIINLKDYNNYYIYLRK